MKRETSSGYKELVFLGRPKDSDKSVATVYDNKNHIGLYACDVGDQQLTCSQVGAAGSSRITFKETEPTKLSYIVESGTQGQPLQKTMEITYQKE